MKQNNTFLLLQQLRFWAVSQHRSPFCKDSHHFPQEDSAAGRQCAGEAQELGKHVSQGQIMRQLDTSQHGSDFRDPRAWGQMRKVDEEALTEQMGGVFSPVFNPDKLKIFFLVWAYLGNVHDVTYKISANQLLRKVGTWCALAEWVCLSFISHCINLSRPVLHQHTQKCTRARIHLHQRKQLWGSTSFLIKIKADFSCCICLS